MLNRLYSIWNPECYHGWGKKRRFFEGWYYKIVSQNQKYALAVIPGIAMDENGEKQAFIQILNGKKLKATYNKFNSAEFKPTPRKHELKIENNFFSNTNLILDLPNIKGQLFFRNLNPWSNSFFSPGIMGPFSFVPFMECYHGILSMDHDIQGELFLDGEKISFDKGKGYIEKDWGHSFPVGYVWMQTNHFSQPGISLKVSIAKIPFLKSSFIGYIAGVLINGKLIEFTTYNGTKLILCKVSEKLVEIEMENNNYVLSIKAEREEATSLAAPISGFMTARIEESLDGNVHVILKNKKSNVTLLNDLGASAGIEVAGDYKVLLKN
tara:strand:+ start:1160 stop:2131 length:972 start_codon:yes stop_codon:yes gene_type:complete